MCCVFVCVYVCGMCHSSVVQVATNSNLPPYACGWQQAKAKKQSTKKKKEVERKSCLLWALPHKYVALMRPPLCVRTSKSAHVFAHLRLYIFHYICCCCCCCWLSVCLISSFAPAAWRLLLCMFLIIMICSARYCCCFHVSLCVSI